MAFSVFQFLIFCCLYCGNVGSFLPLKFNSTWDKDVTLSLPQKALLDRFGDIVRPRLSHSYMKEEMYLVRWLRAKEWNIEDAVNFLMENQRWRREERMDDILREDWTDMQSEYKYYLSSRDRAGQPLAYFGADEIDIRKAVVSGKEKRMLRYIDRCFEEASGLVRDLGKQYKNITRCHLIINFHGYNLVEHGCLRCIPTILKGITSFELHYPEYIDKLYLMNTPSIAQPLLNAVLPLLTPSTRRALKILGTNRKENYAIMAELFDHDEIPVQLGGRKYYRPDQFDEY